MSWFETSFNPNFRPIRGLFQGLVRWIYIYISRLFEPSSLVVPTGSPSRGGDVAVYVFNINQLSLPTPFYSVLVSVSVLWSFQLYFIP